MARDRFKEEKDFEELIAIDNEKIINRTKKDISTLLPKDIKIVAKNDSQKKLINRYNVKFFEDKKDLYK